MNKPYVEGTTIKTEAMYWSYIRGVLRRGWSKYQLKNNSFKGQGEPNNEQFPTKAKTIYPCNVCGRKFPKSMSVNKKVKRLLAIDHIESAGSIYELEEFVRKLFPRKQSDVQIICDYTKDMFDHFGQPSCHYLKTQEERKNRK